MSKAKTGLGRGLETLIPTDFDVGLLLDSKERIQNLFISALVPNPDQPRKHFDKQALDELSTSIKRFGVIQPIIVTPKTADSYVIVAGERRWRASKMAGLEKVPAIVRAEKELEQLEISLIENVQRVDLSPLEQAVSIERLHQQFNMSYNDIAERLGKATTTINNIVRLLQLPQAARKALQSGQITEGHARAVLALKGDESKQVELLQLIDKNHWSVRQAEQFVQTYKQGLSNPRAVQAHMSTQTPETDLLAEHLQTKVTINRTAKGGKLEVHFVSEEDLQRILKTLRSEN